jgi:hypothetical protein
MLVEASDLAASIETQTDRVQKWLNRRSGRRSYNWSDFKKMLEYFQIQKLRVSKRANKVDWY